MVCYTHLSTKEWDKILEGVAGGERRREIGRRIGRDAAAISRELRRNGAGEAGYRPSEAQRRAKERRGCSRRKDVLDDAAKLSYLAEYLEQVWLPEQATDTASRKTRHMADVDNLTHYIWRNFTVKPTASQLTRANPHGII